MQKCNSDNGASPRFQNGAVGLAELQSSFTILAGIVRVLSFGAISWDRVYAEIQWRVALR
jgi:hypothetical protein